MRLPAHSYENDTGTLQLDPTTANAVKSILLEDDYPVSQAAYTNLFSLMYPSSTIVVSSSVQQTEELCAAHKFDLVIIDQKGPALTATTAALLATLPETTFVVMILSLRRSELNIPMSRPNISVIEKPVTVQCLIAALKKRLPVRPDVVPRC